MDHESRMQKALKELKESDAPNIAKVAKSYNLVRTTLSRRFRGETRSRHDFIEQEWKLLTDPQEAEILLEIKRWSKKGLDFTPRILRNVVEEVLGQSIGENWVGRFVERHQSRIESVYLTGFDKERHIADNSEIIETFYGKVRNLGFLKMIFAYIFLA
jgi:hypothetical protein